MLQQEEALGKNIPKPMPGQFLLKGLLWGTCIDTRFDDLKAGHLHRPAQTAIGKIESVVIRCLKRPAGLELEHVLQPAQKDV